MFCLSFENTWIFQFLYGSNTLVLCGLAKYGSVLNLSVPSTVIISKMVFFLFLTLIFFTVCCIICHCSSSLIWKFKFDSEEQDFCKGFSAAGQSELAVNTFDFTSVECYYDLFFFFCNTIAITPCFHSASFKSTDQPLRYDGIKSSLNTAQKQHTSP